MAKKEPVLSQSKARAHFSTGCSASGYPGIQVANHLGIYPPLGILLYNGPDLQDVFPQAAQGRAGRSPGAEVETPALLRPEPRPHFSALRWKLSTGCSASGYAGIQAADYPEDIYHPVIRNIPWCRPSSPIHPSIHPSLRPSVLHPSIHPPASRPAGQPASRPSIHSKPVLAALAQGGEEGMPARPRTHRKSEQSYTPFMVDAKATALPRT